MKLTKQCYSCKQEFRKTELIDYAPPGTKSMHSYCPKCLEEKHSRENFSYKVCKIFGIKAPGPIIWTQRKRLKETYAYSDEIIIDCLDYLYNIKGMKKLSESLVLVTPEAVNEMMKYKQKKTEQLVKSMNMETKEYVVPIQKAKERKKVIWDSDDWLDD